MRVRGRMGRLLAAVLCVVCLLCSPVSPCSSFPAEEMTLLQALHEATGGQDWLWSAEEAALPSWDFSTNGTAGCFLHNPCASPSPSNASEMQAWAGVQCSLVPSQCSEQECRVVTLALEEHNLIGQLPGGWEVLDALEELRLGLNGLTGSVPSSLGELGALRVVEVEENNLSGSVPPELCGAEALRELLLGDNKLTGRLPVELSRLSALEFLSVYENFLTGSIIPEIAELTQLQRLYIFDNLLTGPLLPEMSKLSMLSIYAAHKNRFTGPLISELSHHPYLIVLALQENFLTGTLSHEFSRLQFLHHLYVFDNQMSGTMPSSLGEMAYLQRFSISGNLFTGPIPSQWGNMLNMKHLYLYNNFLTSYLPESIGNLIHLELFSAYGNYLSGPLIPGFANMSKLGRLLLQNNRLTGSINNNAIFAPGMILDIVDLSNNKLSGAVPSNIFKLSRITTIALSLNCFQGDLPSDMCSASELQVLSMDGLGGAEGCKHEYVIPITGIPLFNTLDGTVPRCLWNLENLTVLHLSSNGLRGSIAHRDDISHESTITDLSLAHNHLTGTIPQNIRARNFTYVDLSYNKLSGKHHDTREFVNPNNSVVILEVNRLSGPLPPGGAFHLVQELKILRDNLFSCDHIPSEDAYSEDYSCGSQNLKSSLYLLVWFMGFVCAIVAIWAIAVKCFWCRVAELHIAEFVNKHTSYLTLFQSRKMKSVKCVALIKLYNMQYCFRALAVLIVCMFFVSIFAGAPLYVIKLSEYGHAEDLYSTHSFQYLWVVSMAYVSGELPAVLVMGAWLTVITSCYFLFKKWDFVVGALSAFFFSWQSLLGLKSAEDSGDVESGPDLITHHRKISRVESKTAITHTESFYSRFTILFIVNLFIVGSANIAYVYSEHQALSSSIHTACQITLAICKTLYTSSLLPTLTARILKLTEKRTQVRGVLYVFNSLFIPTIATSFSSPSCFQNLIVKPDEITSAYYYKYCSLFEPNSDGSIRRCLEMTTETVDVIPMTPPFSYNNLCFSVLLTTYIPVYIFVYTFKAISPFVIVPVLTNIDYLSVPRIFRHRASFYGMCWPNFWRKNHFSQESDTRLSHYCPPEDEDISTPRILFDDKKFRLSLSYHMTILLTFGVCSPLLAFTIVLSVVLQMYMHVYLVGRFVQIRLGSSDFSDFNNVEDHAVEELSKVNIDIRSIFDRLMWPLLWASAFFFALMTWDIVVDVTNSAVKAIWAPLVCISIPAVMKITSIFYHKWRYRAQSSQNQGLLNKKDRIQKSDTVTNDAL